MAAKMAVGAEKEMIEDVMVTAFEGGADWIRSIQVLREVEGADEVYDTVTMGGSLSVITDEGNKYILDIVAMRKGIREAAKLRGMTKADWFDNHDAIEASNALQFACMGEVRFG